MGAFFFFVLGIMATIIFWINISREAVVIVGAV
jgi:hypothetical protein